MDLDDTEEEEVYNQELDSFTDTEFIEERSVLSLKPLSNIPKLVELILPMQLSETTKLILFGTIIHNKPAFYTERYLFPEQYTITRMWSSIKESKLCEWKCQIIQTLIPQLLSLLF